MSYINIYAVIEEHKKLSTRIEQVKKIIREISAPGIPAHADNDENSQRKEFACLTIGIFNGSHGNPMAVSHGNYEEINLRPIDCLPLLQTRLIQLEIEFDPIEAKVSRWQQSADVAVEKKVSKGEF